MTLMSAKPEPATLHCANPACRRILAPREGQTLEFEIVSVSVAASDDEPSMWDESPRRDVTRVYLCTECANTASVTVGPEGIVVIPQGSRPE